MNSDFDDLLNEFTSEPSTNPTNQSRSTRLASNEIDDFLEELKGIEQPERIEPPRYQPLSQSNPPKKSLQKCYPTLLSGQSNSGYCSSSANPKPCDKLRCTRCDLPVKRFLNKQWKPEAEYLFFRNNFSRDDKLATMMNSVQGSAAYNCQCLWRSASENTNMNGEAWVCGGHMV